MTVQTHTTGKVQVNQALETSIQVGLAAFLVIGCLLILRPFIPLVMWGIIIAIASYPTFLKLQNMLGGRAALSAVLWTLLLLAVLIVPLVLERVAKFRQLPCSATPGQPRGDFQPALRQSGRCR